MSRRTPATLAAGLVAGLLALAPVAYAQPHDHGAAAGQASASLQGDDARSWMADPHIHQFYDLSVATLGKGAAAAADVPAFEAKAFAIFRAFGSSRGMEPAAMQDHLKLIPRQVVQIVKDDPHVLDSYQAFTDAMFGPP